MVSTSQQWFAVLDIPLEKDLSVLLLFLQHQGVVPYVTDEGQSQRLWVSHADDCEKSRQWAEQWLCGELVINQAQPSQAVSSAEKARRSSDKVLVALWRFPVTVLTVVLGVIGALLIETYNSFPIAHWFLFQAVEQQQFVSLQATLEKGHYWRLITPIFLHVGWAHIIFNGLILWEFGRRVEYAKGSAHLITILLIAAVLSNVTQYFITPNVPFGGLSGVNYALVGYIAVYQSFITHPVLQFNKAMIAFLLVWLLLGVFGVIDFFMAGSIANGAHVAGLVTGVLFGGMMVWRDKK